MSGIENSRNGTIRGVKVKYLRTIFNKCRQSTNSLFDVPFRESQPWHKMT